MSPENFNAVEIVLELQSFRANCLEKGLYDQVLTHSGFPVDLQNELEAVRSNQYGELPVCIVSSRSGLGVVIKIDGWHIHTIVVSDSTSNPQTSALRVRSLWGEEGLVEKAVRSFHMRGAKKNWQTFVERSKFSLIDSDYDLALSIYEYLFKVDGSKDDMIYDHYRYCPDDAVKNWIRWGFPSTLASS